MWTKNLDDYMEMQPTNSCYLDGKYFNKVFEKYPGLLSNHLHIKIVERQEKEKVWIHMHQNQINTEFPGLLRLVIEINGSKHSNLLILDYKNGVVHRFEPLGKNARFFQKINDLIEDYLSIFMNIKIELIDINLDDVWDEKNPECLRRDERSGFCIAYIIMYAYDFLKERDFNPEHIRRFAKKIELTYGELEGSPDIEYGDDDKFGKMALGGVAGLGVGGLLGGVGGAALGGIGGLAIGSLL